jgi:hypothetical protein
MPATIDFTAASPSRITAEAFWDRFKNTELVDLDIASQYRPLDTVPLQKDAARRRVFRIDVQEKGFTRLLSNKTVTFVTALETDNLIAAGRASEILNTPITFDEAYRG